MTSEERELIILGAEHDARLRSVLLATLQALGGVLSNPAWGVAGSQEIVEADVELNGQCVHIESETFVGLSIEGPTELVRMIDARVRDRLQRREPLA